VHINLSIPFLGVVADQPLASSPTAGSPVAHAVSRLRATDEK
jgi:hypothetical protein